MKEKVQLGDEETVEQIWDNAHMLYFSGYPATSDHRPFQPSMTGHNGVRRFCSSMHPGWARSVIR